MKQGLLASLTCLVLVACGAAGPTSIPTTSPTPTQTAGSQPPPTAIVAPSLGASVTPPFQSATPAPTAPPGSSGDSSWRERSDIAAGPAAREDHTWTVGDSGQAFLFGGRTADGPQADLWAFDTESDTWTLLQPPGPGPAPRFGHTATWVPGVGLVVWSGQGRDFFADIWAYDPLVNAWRELPSIGAVPQARYGSCASLGPDGRLWISHGFTQDDGRFADTRAYEFTTGEWTDMTPSGDAPIKRCLHDCYWSDAGQLILYGGQTTGVPALGDIWAYDPTSSEWHQGTDKGASPRQLYGLAVLNASTAIVFGGGSVERGYLEDTLLIDPTAIEVDAISPAGGQPPARSGATLIAPPLEHRVLLFGGLNEGGLLDDVWEFQAEHSGLF